MSAAGKQFADRLTDSAATYYTTPASTYSQITALTLTNTSTTTELTVTLYLVPSGGSASDDNIILDAKSLQPQASYVVAEGLGQILAASAFLQGLASTTELVAIRGSVVEFT